ncbi:uncharacterized protein LOC134814991 isoform X4 [Bolinopsis microptera]|uniref:uncharacterized protein LOC134814991 isoform X4 n=1 Tax=Bolinopsis microptera TaxID=2820187 RepID=UPI003079E2E0
MTSVPLPSHLNGTTAKRESALQKYTYSGDSCETRLPRYHATSTKMNVFQSISSFLRKNKKVPERAEPLQAKRPAERKGSSVAESDDADNSDKRVEEESYEGSELSDDNKDDIAFVRSTFRQSVKRAIGWRKSQRKAVNKRKKENIHNSKLLTGGTKDEDEFYDDTELDVVVITEADGIPDDPQIKRLPVPSSSKGSKIPKRRNSTKRPAVSLKSSGFFSQSVARPRKRPDSISLRPDPWAHAETTFTRSRHTAKSTRTCSLSMNQNRPPPVQRNHTRHPTWDGGQTRNRNTTSRSSTRSLSAVRGRNMNLSRSSLAGSQIPRYLGSTSSVSSPGTTSPDYMFPGHNMNLADLDFSDSDTENCRVPPWRNNEILHAYSRSTAETRPSSRATSSSWSSNRTRSSSTTGSRYQSRNSSWSGRQCQNSKSTSNIRSTLTPSRTDMTGSQSRIPRYLGSTTSMSSISPMSTEYHVPGLHFNYADLDFSDSDGSEKTRCDSTSKRSEGGKTVTARTNKASELREVAIKKKLESTPGQSTTVPAAPAPTARRKPRASFRTKKGISRRPVHKKDIKPAENKASQLRAKKNKRN